MSSTALHRIPRASASLKTASLTPGADVAAITRYAPSRSAGANVFARHSTFPCAIHWAMAGVTCGATTRTRASAAKRPSIFPSATPPPPTTTTRRSRSFTKMGNRLMLAFDSQRHAAGRGVAFDWSDKFSGQPSANLLVRVAREKAAQIFAGRALPVEFAQHPLDGVRPFGSRGQVAGDSRGMLVLNIDDQQVLHDGVAEMPIGVAVGEIRCGAQLLRCYAPAQHIRANVGKAGLLLCVNANVIAVHVRGKLFRFGGIERKTEPILQRVQEGVRRPAVLQEKELQAGALTVLAEHFRFTKQGRHAAYNGDSLLPPHECVQANAEMRISGETASHTQRESDLIAVQAFSLDSGKSYIIDLRIRAPRTATSDRNLELTRQIVELGIAAKLSVHLQRQR